MKILVCRFLSVAIMFTASSVLAYGGSSFNQVLSVLKDQNFTPANVDAKNEFSIYEADRLPQYPVNTISIFLNGAPLLYTDAVRTLSEREDYYDRLAKKLHPNGVCVTGQWNITQPTAYTGALSTGFKGLFVGRISVAMEDTTSDDDRGFGFAGKVFPTLDPNQVVKTGNFFSVDVLMGTDLQHVLDAKPTNEPELGFNLSLMGLAMKIAATLSMADQNPGFRPLTQIAAVGHEGKIAHPQWIRISLAGEAKRNNEADFRNEILRAMQENKELTYSIDVSTTTKDRNAKKGWNKIGEIKLNQAMVSYGCDRRLHFAHPKLK